MENQEKHPVDELFARRLREVEKAPSSRAWNTLERQLSRKKNNSNGKRGGWLAVAASVAVLAGCFVAVRYWQPDASQVAATKDRTGSQTATVEKPREKSRQSQSQTEQPVDTETEQIAEEVAPVVELRAVEQPATEKFAKNFPKRTVKPTVPQEKQKTEQTPAPMQMTPLATDNQETIAAVQPTAQPAQKPASEVTVVVVELPEETPNNTENTAATEPDQSAKKKAAKLWQAIKRAKQSEINVDKDALFAWVKEKNQKTEK
jgi:hypothetical protein